MSTIEEKIKATEYSSAVKAAASIKMSGHSKKEKEALFALIPFYYPEAQPPIDTLKETSTFNGESKPLVKADVTALALKVMTFAAKHHLTREQVFDLLKERILAE